jgi:hypothetical protein
VDDRDGLITTLQHRLPRLLGQCDLMLEEVGRGEGVVAENCVPRCELDCTNCKRNGSRILRESSRWLWLPTLGFSMKNWWSDVVNDSLSVSYEGLTHRHGGVVGRSAMGAQLELIRGGLRGYRREGSRRNWN